MGIGANDMSTKQNDETQSRWYMVNKVTHFLQATFKNIITYRIAAAWHFFNVQREAA